MRHPLRTALVALLLPLVGACDGGPSALGPEGGELARARQRWAATRPAAYAITVRVSCFCMEAGRAVVHEVRGTALVARRDAATGEELPIVPSLAITVDDLFARIDAAQASGAQVVRARYDATRGYPVELYIDQSAQLADEEYDVAVSDFAAR
jgi:hypothetical protein